MERSAFFIPLIIMWAIVLLLLLTGCAPTSSAPVLDSTNIEGTSASIVYVEVHTPDGTVPCLVYRNYNQGGMDCDWTVIR